MRRTILLHCLFSLILLGIAGWLLQCATNPVTGKREFMLMSESQEIQLGRETDPQIIASYGLYQDDALTRYID
ncbi:MAG: peptidase M48, partial [Gemmatimonadota bacterium]